MKSDISARVIEDFGVGLYNNRKTLLTGTISNMAAKLSKKTVYIPQTHRARQAI